MRTTSDDEIERENVLAECNDKDNSCATRSEKVESIRESKRRTGDAFEKVKPLLALALLAADVDHAIGARTVLKHNLAHARRASLLSSRCQVVVKQGRLFSLLFSSYPRRQDVVDARLIVGLRDALDVFEKSVFEFSKKKSVSCRDRSKKRRRTRKQRYSKTRSGN